MAGPGRVRSTGDRRRCGLREGGQRDGKNLGCSRDAAALAGSLTARSFAPSLRAVRPPARLLPAACSLSRSPSRLSPLTPELTSQPIAGTPERRTCPAQPRWRPALDARGRTPISRLPVPVKGEVEGRATVGGLLKTEH